MPPVKLFSQAIPWRGLWVAGGKDVAPQGALRRARGIARVRDGPLRSRLGSTLAHALDAHSLARYNGKRYAGATDKLYENGAQILSGLDGTRLTFAKMPPTLAKQDYLFVAGGGNLVKVSPAGLVSNWGIAAPGANPTATDNGVGTLAAGDYDYYITFLNQSTGHRSNSNPAAAEVTIGANRQIRLTNIPTSGDTQVDAREVWRTTAGGSQPFRLAIITDNVTTTYDDTGSVALSAIQLPTDNAPPDDTFEDCVGPFAGRMWWCRDTAVGAQGRIYYSPIGRPESVEGFLDATNPDDIAQKLVIWDGLWVMSNRTWKRVISTTAAPLETRGVPGSTKPFTVATTPQGILYEAEEGVRLFNGAQSVLVSVEALGTLFQGVAAENLSAFNGVVAGHARDEYLISDETQTLAFNTRTSTWRDLGIGIKAVLYEEDTQKVQVSASSKVLLFEEEGVREDDGVDLAFAVEFPSAFVDPSSEATIQHIFFDLDTNGEPLTPVLILDGTEISLATISCSGRQVIETPVMRKGRVVGLRLTGTVDAEIVLYDITADVYLPQTVGVPA